MTNQLRHVLWVGGSTGAGKSTVARFLTERYGLVHYNYDWHDARSHAERTRLDRHPERNAFLRMPLDERWVTRTPQEMLRSGLADQRERFELVLEDLLAMPVDRRIVAEGFGLLPELVAPLLAVPRQAIFIVSTPELRELARAQRGSWIAGTSDDGRARSNLLARDRLHAEFVAHSANELGLEVLRVDGSKGVEETVAVVERHFDALLATGSRA